MRGWQLWLTAVFLSTAADAAPTLETQPATMREVVQTYTLEGVIEARQQSTVSTQVSGRIVSLYFDVGDRVRKGQIIARLDEAELRQQQAGSRAQVAQAEAQLTHARTQLERSQQLQARQFISAAAVDKARADHAAAQAQLDHARAVAGQSAATRAHATVTAPYDGVVAARHVEIGEMALPGKPLLTGFDPRALRVVVQVPQHRLEAVRLAARAQIEVPGRTDRLTGLALTLLPAADARTHSTRVRVDLPPDIPGLRPGMAVRVHFDTGRIRRLLLPQTAVVRRSGVTAVYVVDAQGQPHLRQVRLGELIGSDELEVLAGLSAGERIALDPVRAGIARAAMPR